MFTNFFGFGKSANHAISQDIYSQIVAAARQPYFFSHCNVPDTPLGRFEMISTYMFLFLHHMQGKEGAPKELTQEVLEIFFTEVDHSLRELGIGDTSVPKRMKKLARMFYGRLDSYGRAIDEHDKEALALALHRNICPKVETWPQSQTVAKLLLQAFASLQKGNDEDIMLGKISFPVLDENGECANG